MRPGILLAGRQNLSAPASVRSSALASLDCDGHRELAGRLVPRSVGRGAGHQGRAAREEAPGSGHADSVLFVYHFASRQIRNVGLATFDFALAGDSLVMEVSEAEQGEDLDGNGEIDGWVDHVLDLAQGTTWNLGLNAPAKSSGPSEFRIRGNCS